MYQAGVGDCLSNQTFDDLISNLPEESKSAIESVISLFNDDVPTPILFSFLFKILLNLNEESNENLNSTIFSPSILPMIFKLLSKSYESIQIDVFNRLTFICQSFKNASICCQANAPAHILSILSSLTEPAFKAAVEFLIVLLRRHFLPEYARLLFEVLKQLHYYKNGTKFSILLNAINFITNRKKSKTVFEWSGASDGGILVPEVAVKGSYTLCFWTKIQLPKENFEHIEYQTFSLLNSSGNGIMIFFSIRSNTEINLCISSRAEESVDTQTFNFNFFPQRWYNIIITYLPRKFLITNKGFTLWVDGKKIETKVLNHSGNTSVFDRCYWGYISRLSFNKNNNKVFRGQMTVMLLLDDALNCEKIQSLYKISHVNVRDYLNTIDTNIIFLYHPQATLNNLAIDVFGKNHGLIFGSLTFVKCMHISDAICCVGGIEMFCPLLLGLEKFSFICNKKKLENVYSPKKLSFNSLNNANLKTLFSLTNDNSFYITNKFDNEIRTENKQSHINLHQKPENDFFITHDHNSSDNGDSIRTLRSNSDVSYQIQKTDNKKFQSLNMSDPFIKRQATTSTVKNYLRNIKKHKYYSNSSLEFKNHGDSILFLIITCIAYILHTGDLAQRSLSCTFFRVLSSILERIPKEHLNTKFLNSIDLLVTATSSLDDRLVKTSYTHFLWNPYIWTRTSYYIQCQHQLLFKSYINANKEYIRQVITVSVLLNDFCLFYSYSGTKKWNNKLNIEKAYPEIFESNINYENLKYQSKYRLPTHDYEQKLKSQEIRNLRMGIINFVKCIVSDCLNINEMKTLLSFITCSSDYRDTLELGSFLLKILHCDKHTENFEVLNLCGSYSNFFVLLSHPNEYVRILAIQIIIRILILTEKSKKQNLLNELMQVLKLSLSMYEFTMETFTALLGIIFESEDLVNSSFAKLEKNFKKITFSLSNSCIFSSIFYLIAFRLKNVNQVDLSDCWLPINQILNITYKILLQVTDLNDKHSTKIQMSKDECWASHLVEPEVVSNLIFVQIEVYRNVLNSNCMRKTKTPNLDLSSCLVTHQLVFKIIKLIVIQSFIKKKNGYNILHLLEMNYNHVKKALITQETKIASKFNHAKFLRKLLYNTFKYFNNSIDKIHKNNIPLQNYSILWENLLISLLIVENLIFNNGVESIDLDDMYCIQRKMYRSKKKFYDDKINQVFNIVNLEYKSGSSGFVIGEWKDFELFVVFLRVYNSLIPIPSKLHDHKNQELSNSWSESEHNGLYLIELIKNCDDHNYSIYKKFKFVNNLLYIILIALFDIVHVSDLKELYFEKEKTLSIIEDFQKLSSLKHLNLESTTHSICTSKIQNINLKKIEINIFYTGTLLLIEKLVYYLTSKSTKQNFSFTREFFRSYSALSSAMFLSKINFKVPPEVSVLYVIGKIFGLLIIFNSFNKNKKITIKLIEIVQRIFTEYFNIENLSQVFPDMSLEIEKLKSSLSNLNSSNFPTDFLCLVHEFLVSSTWKSIIVFSTKKVESFVMNFLLNYATSINSEYISKKYSTVMNQETFESTIKSHHQANYTKFLVIKNSYLNRLTLKKNVNCKLLAKTWHQLNTGSSVWNKLLVNFPLTSTGNLFFKLSKSFQSCGIRKITKINYAGTEHTEAVFDYHNSTSSSFVRSDSATTKKSISKTQMQFYKTNLTYEISNDDELVNNNDYNVSESFENLSIDQSPCILNVSCEFIIPEITIPGTFYISNDHIFFMCNDKSHLAFRSKLNNAEQRTEDNEEQAKPEHSYSYLTFEMFKNKFYNRKWRTANITSIQSRRYMLKYTALEIEMSNRRSYLFNFSSGINKKVYQTLKKLVHTSDSMSYFGSASELYKFYSNVTDMWVKRQISNFEYLIHLNKVASRSFNDLMQYPVFPWILSDYESETIDLKNPFVYRNLKLPIGALNESRLQKFKERYELFVDEKIPKFHYGSHYSSAGAVMFYLIRLEPFTSLFLCLQGGKFDYPDRLFSSISETWSNCLNSTTDVKELIPEFFYLPEIFCNDNNFNFGTKLSNNKPVGNVDLPRWAQGSAEKFVRINREALESDYVSENLHNWIDLIFGYKQLGPAALESFNVYYYLTYEQNVNLLNSENEETRRAVLSQIENFGQTPPQLLNYPHPTREPKTAIEYKIITNLARENSMNVNSSSPLVDDNRHESLTHSAFNANITSKEKLTISNREQHQIADLNDRIDTLSVQHAQPLKEQFLTDNNKKPYLPPPNQLNTIHQFSGNHKDQKTIGKKNEHLGTINEAKDFSEEFLDEFQLVTSDENIAQNAIQVSKIHLNQFVANICIEEYLVFSRYDIPSICRYFIFPLKDHLILIDLYSRLLAYRIHPPPSNEVSSKCFFLNLEFKSEFSIKTCPIVFSVKDENCLKHFKLDIWKSCDFYDSLINTFQEQNRCYPNCPFLVIEKMNAIYVLFSGAWDGYLELYQIQSLSKSHLMYQWKAHKGTISCMSQDKDWLLTGATDFTAILWKLNFIQNSHISKKFLYLITGHNAPLSDVCISKDWNTIVTASLDGLVLLHYVDTQKQHTRALISNEGPVTLVRILLDGSVLVFCLKNRRMSRYSINAHLYNTRDFNEPITHVFVVPSNEKIIIATTDYTIYIMNAYSLEILGSYKIPEGIFHVAFSQDWMFMFVSTLKNSLITLTSKNSDGLFKPNNEFTCYSV